MDTYKTIDSKSEGYFRDKGSRFLAFAYPVQNEEDISEILASLKKEYHNARHHCYAWRLGTEVITFRANDDGEPSSTAGKPILGQLLSNELTNILVVVVRYFGGTLLGTGGLINAYRTATADAISNAKIITGIIEEKYKLKFSYNEMNDVMQIIKQENLNVLNTRFELDCELDFSVRKSESERIREVFEKFYGVDIEYLDEG
ncbi:MAG: YigZ family protein [Mariniphaga sp.]